MSQWYAAHLLMYVKRKNNADGAIPVWENIILIKADSEAAAFAKAQARGEQDAGDDGGSFHWAGQPSEWIFAGVRKLTLCEDSEKRPGDGCEISYLEMEVNSEQALFHLLEGKASTVLLNDRFERPREPIAKPTAMPQSANA